MSAVPTTPTAPATRSGLWRRLRGPQGRNLWFLAFVAPFIVGLLLFVYIPIAWSAYLSFFEARNTVTPCPSSARFAVSTSSTSGPSALIRRWWW